MRTLPPALPPLLLGLCAASALVPTGCASPAPVFRASFTNDGPQLVEQPSAAEIWDAAPAAARLAGRGGVVFLRCQVNANGAVDRCAVQQAIPGSEEFEPAALALMARYHYRGEPGPVTQIISFWPNGIDCNEQLRAWRTTPKDIRPQWPALCPDTPSDG